MVGVPVDLRGLDYLASVVDYWSANGAEDIRIDVIFNGQVSPRVPEALRAAVDRSRVPISASILPLGYLPGRLPQLRAQQLLRSRVLAGDATHLLFHEVYRMPSTSEALQHLLDASSDVAGALYRDPYALGFYCVYEFTPEPRESFRYDVLPDPLPDVPIPVPGIGFGFTLISRGTLAAVPFRGGSHAADSYFSFDATRLGFTILACPFIVSNSKVDDDPEILKSWRAAHHGQPPRVSPDSPHRFPTDYRARVVRAYLEGADSLQVVATKNGVPEPALTRWVHQASLQR